MKILTQHQCSECNGTGRNKHYKKLIEENGGNNISYEKWARITNETPSLCQKCKGAKVTEEWLELKDFAEQYLGLTIKTEDKRSISRD